MFFDSVKEINSLRKEINRLFRKGMLNINLKATIETSIQKLLFKTSIFFEFKKFPTSTHADIVEF